MKKAIIVFEIIIMCIVMLGCNQSEANEKKYINHCTLIINGKDCSNSCYADVDKENKQAVISFSYIAKELGATVEQEGDNITISYGEDDFSVDLQRSDFGIWFLPGKQNNVRRVIDGEVIVDAPSVEAWLYNVLGATITVDYEKSEIVIEN